MKEENTHSILITTSSFGSDTPHLFEILQKKGFQVALNLFGRKLTEEELDLLLHQHKPIGLLAGTEPITSSTLQKAKGYLRVISRVGVGWDNIDRDAAKEFNIQVYRTEGVLEQAVAELTIGFILSALRKIPQHDQKMRNGIWQKSMGHLLKGKTVGIVGFGAIGQRVGELVNVFGAKVVYFDPVSKNVFYAEAVSLQDLLAQSDIISIHASTAEQILGEKELNLLCKKGVMIINTARGSLVNERALCEALISGRASVACLDVFEQEPYFGPLVQLDNVILTPHIGSYAMEARIHMEEMAVENLIIALEKSHIERFA